MTKSFDEIVNLCLNGTDGDNNTYTAISLCESSDLISHKNTFSSQKERVDEVIRSVVREEDGKRVENEPLNINDVILVDADAGASINNNTHLFVSTKMQECILHENGQSFQGGNTLCHYYAIRDDELTRLKSLTVTVVYTGAFDGPKYNSGKLTVELRHQANASDLPVSIGSAPDELQIPNTEKEIGRAIIQHETKQSVIEAGLFEVTVSAGANVSYSISLGGSFACPLTMEVKRDMACLLAKRIEIIDCTNQSILLEKKSVLLDRKRVIENKLVEEARGRCVQTELEMQALDLELDGQDEMEDGGASIIQQINDLKEENDDSYRLFSLRVKLNDNLSSEMKRLAEERELLRQRMKVLKEEVENSESMLSKLAASVWGDEASKLIMSQLVPDHDESREKLDTLVPATCVG